VKIISLNGAWKMRAADESGWREAIVPGTVYTDLLRDGDMEDPFWRENEREAFARMEKGYEYVRTFEVGAEDLDADSVILRCEGLDTLCHVYLNGAHVADTNNMHRTWEFDAQKYLRAGENEIRVVLDSPLRYIREENEKRPCWQSTDATPGFPHIRKTHCQFGWDWGPRLPDAGIWRDIELQFIRGGRLPDVMISQTHAPGHVTLRVAPMPELRGEIHSVEMEITVTSPDGGVYTADEAGTVEIDHPRLWWPANQGEQPLYTVRVILLVNGEEADRWEKRIGLRTIEVRREKQPDGESFGFVVNGRPVFAMGADYIPEDNLFGRLSAARTRKLLEDAKAANMNMIRVWGGGYYPSDDFFDTCDELGLMVWQDFMFACAYYDLTEEFEQNIIAEAEDNVRRIRHHACLALLCGNNEMEEFHYFPMREELGSGHTGWKNVSPKYHADYTKMFEYILPKITKELAPEVFYWPSSPSSGGAFDNPVDGSRGDVHYWDVWHGDKPFTDYLEHRFRFVSEFGFQSFPNLPTVESFTLPDDRNIFSRIMERHQRNLSANGKIMNYLSRTYLYPKDFDHLLYCSQLLQAEAVRCGVEHWRRDRGYCMGTIYWQLNDCWPVASWASIDYYGRWKALHYAAKRFFAPVMISAREHGETDQNPHINEFHPEQISCGAELYVCNESPDAASGTVTWSLRNAAGEIKREDREEVTVNAGEAKNVAELKFPEADMTGDYLYYAFESTDGNLSEGVVLFCAPKHFRHQDPCLKMRREGDTLIVTAEAFAQSVEIMSEDPDLLLSDNYFSMNPGERRVRILRGTAEQPRARSVYDIAR